LSQEFNQIYHFQKINTMKASILIALLPLAMAMPTLESRQTYTACSGTDSNALCCATDVLGLADLDCAQVASTPTSLANFTSMCAAIGQRARCCALPILDQALLCVAPI